MSKRIKLYGFHQLVIALILLNLLRIHQSVVVIQEASSCTAGPENHPFLDAVQVLLQ